MLHVTNGDSAGYGLREAGMRGTILPWRDVLHDGPVPAGLDLAALSEVRADFIASRGAGPADELRRDFAARDATLAAASAEDEVVLWFEHDLYDQLQLIQLLDWLADHPHPRLSLVNPGEYLGMAAPDRLRELFAARAPVTEAQLALGRAAWEAFRGPDPHRLEAVARGDTSALPHLGAALVRWMEELPSTVIGLSRTEESILHTLRAMGPLTRMALYPAAHHEVEEAVWMGDSSFFEIVDALAAAETPLLAYLDPPPADPADVRASVQRGVRLTDAGEEVLDGVADAVRLNGIDRWWGGVRLHGRDVPWRWDPGAERIATA
jgi:hypothetical protein